MQIIYNMKEKKKKKKPDINIKFLCLSKDKQQKVDKKIKNFVSIQRLLEERLIRTIKMHLCLSKDK